MKRLKLNKFIPGLIILVIGYSLGFLHGHHNFEFEKGIKPRLVNTTLRKPSEIDFSLFWDAYDIVNSKYVKSFDSQALVYGAISGFIESLKDPFSAFLTPSEAKLLTDDLKGQFGGIGAELADRDGRLTIVSPIDGSPAAKAGLKPKDEIIKIDDKDVSLMSFGEAITKIRGDKGTKITLTIVREKVEKPFDVTVVRDIISVESVKLTEKDEIAILRITQFNEDTVKLIRNQESKLKSKKGIVIDLRNNPGGLLQTAIDVVSLFDDQSPVVIEEEKGGARKEFKTTLPAIFKNQKIVILINEGSASASEIFAGALQDHKRAIVVGMKSFGKGSVQNLESLKDGSVVRITVAAWLTPNGRQINGTGIEPDVEVINDSKDDDKQLIKTLELLK